jgi:Predicted membrane protein
MRLSIPISSRNLTAVAYLCMLAGSILPPFLLPGMVLAAHVKARGMPQHAAHASKMLANLYMALAIGVGGLLIFKGDPAFAGAFVAWIWFIYRIVAGMLKLGDEKRIAGAV